MVRELVRKGHTVEVVTALPNHPAGRIYPEFRGRLYQREDREGAQVHRTWVYACVGSGLGRYLNYLSFAFTSSFGVLKTEKPDVIFVESPPPLLALIGIAMSKRWKIPVVLNVSDLWPDVAVDLGLLRKGLLLSTLRSFEAWVYKHSTFVTAVTEGIAQSLMQQKHLPKNKILFLPNGLDADKQKPLLPDLELKRSLGLEGTTVLLYAGTAGYAHAADKFLHAAKLLANTDLHFLFVGGGSATNELQHLAQGLRLTNVSFLPAVTAEMVTRLYSIAFGGLASIRDCDAMASARPAKMLAAMACGKPVVYAGEGEGARLLEEAGGGIVVRSPEPEALAAAIRDLIANPLLASHFGRAGRKYVEDHLTWPMLIENWLVQLAAATQRSQFNPVYA
jgi:glycosyltransferase involved in cell wall biosynthesis